MLETGVAAVSTELLLACDIVNARGDTFCGVPEIRVLNPQTKYHSSLQVCSRTEWDTSALGAGDGETREERKCRLASLEESKDLPDRRSLPGGRRDGEAMPTQDR